jgi:hypothetical protein
MTGIFEALRDRSLRRAGAAVLLSAALASLSRADEPGDGESHVELGFEARVRTENWDNLQDFSDATEDLRHQIRYRTRLWARFDFGGRTELAIGIDNESRKIYTPDTPFQWDETIFETLYLDHRFDARWSARLGRQNLMGGDAFLLFEGTPLDGSRTVYFNALDVTFSSQDSRLEMIAISNPYRDDALPVFHDADRKLVEWDEQALALYWTRRPGSADSVEAYYVYKTETDDPRPASDPKRQPDRHLSTLGARAVRNFGAGWSAAGEAAVQWGGDDLGDDLRAWGGYVTGTKTFDAASRPSVSLGWFGLSGDDLSTADREGWDPVFSRWPKWSELYIYTLAGETGVAYWTNLSTWQAEFLITPLPALKLRATYYRLRALESYPGDPANFGAGRDRGDLLEARADLAIGKRWRGHLLVETFDPGDFYAGDDAAWFLRAEVIFNFSRKLRL